MNRLLINAAASVDATPALLPVIRELFTGLDSLGSSPARAASMLRRAGIGPGSRVLDLGCGKGAAAVHLAQTLGCSCIGVDAMPEFIEAARSLAKSRGVARLCSFHIGDLTKFAKPQSFDAAIMLGVLDVERGRRVLRKAVKRGGVFIIDDAVAVRPSKSWPTIEEARRILQRGGDRIEAQDAWTPRQSQQQEERLYRQMSQNAERISHAHPRLRRPLDAFLQRQKAAAKLLRTQLQAVQWLVRVAGPAS